MSPEVKINGRLVADVPDETGWHQALDGTPLYVDVSLIEAKGNRQILGLNGLSVGGVRVVGLTQEGKGNSGNSKKGGDGKEPALDIALHDRPIRVSYSPRIGEPILVVTGMGDLYLGYRRGERRTLRNPRWVKGHGQR